MNRASAGADVRPFPEHRRRLLLGGGVAAIVVVALNLRPAVVAVGPLTDGIRSDTGLSSSAVGLLTTVPLVCLGVFAAVAPPLARRIGFERGVLVAVGAIVAGFALRLPTPVTALFAGTVVAGAGIALANVLLPALIKRDFPQRVGAMMALYSVALQTGATVAAGVAVPLGAALGLGWRPSLALWGLPAAVAVIAWLPLALRPRPPHDSARPSGVWRTGLGRACAVFLGLQSAVYFSMTAWLPSLLQAGGMDAGRAGLMLSVVGLAGIVGGLPVPILAARLPDQRMLVAFVVVTFLVGLTGLFLDPVPLVVVWTIALGLGQGAGLSLALTLFTLRSRTAEGAAQLSGMAQTGGYVIASAGPLAIGTVHDLTGGWTVPLIVLIAALVPLAAAGWVITQPRFLEDESTSR